VERDSLFIELKNRTTNGKFTFKLNLEDDGESTFLKGSVHISDGSKKILPFYLIKVNSNASTYVKPTGVTKTGTFPPPPPRAN